MNIPWVPDEAYSLIRHEHSMLSHQNYIWKAMRTNQKEKSEGWVISRDWRMYFSAIDSRKFWSEIPYANTLSTHIMDFQQGRFLPFIIRNSCVKFREHHTRWLKKHAIRPLKNLQISDWNAPEASRMNFLWELGEGSFEIQIRTFIIFQRYRDEQKMQEWSFAKIDLNVRSDVFKRILFHWKDSQKWTCCSVRGFENG